MSAANNCIRRSCRSTRSGFVAHSRFQVAIRSVLAGPSCAVIGTPVRGRVDPAMFYRHPPGVIVREHGDRFRVLAGQSLLVRDPDVGPSVGIVIHRQPVLATLQTADHALIFGLVGLLAAHLPTRVDERLEHASHPLEEIVPGQPVADHRSDEALGSLPRRDR